MAANLSQPQLENSFSNIPPKYTEIHLYLGEISLGVFFKYENKTIEEYNIRNDYGISIVGIIKKNGQTIINPDPKTKLSTSDILLINRCR